jgi:tRNA 2-thiocytidine biosynthesis protein TtcA
MISDNDKVMIAVSGGKDSLVMLDMLSKLQSKAPVKFDILVVAIDSGFGANYSKLESYFKSKKVNYIIHKSRIFDVLKKQMKEQKKTGNYCFMCSRLRRGLLYKLAQEHKCTKIALGHNLDDAIQTLLLNMSYNSRLESMKPIYTSDDGKNVIIRPLIEIPESLILNYSKEEKMPILKQKCPLKKEDSKRQMMKETISKISDGNKFFYSSMQNILDKTRNNKFIS